MEDLTKLYRELIDLMQRLEKAGTFEKFFENVKPTQNINIILYGMPSINGDNSYQKIKEHCYSTAAIELQTVEKSMAYAKALIEHPKKLYNSYASNKDDIKHPDLIKFMEDYEKDNECHIDKS